MDPNIIGLLQLLASQGDQSGQRFGGAPGSAPPSGLEPLASLSGLFSGPQGDASLSGQGGSMSGVTGAGGISGMQPGPGLEFFTPGPTGGGDTTGAANLSDIGSVIGGTLGLQQIASGQGTGGYAQAGETSPVAGPSQGYSTAGQGGSSTVDPLSIAARVLGLAKGGIGLASPLLQGDSQTLGDTGGTSLSDQVRSGGAAYTSPSFVPTSDWLTQLADSGGGVPNIAALLTPGAKALLESGVSPDQLDQYLGGLEQATAYGGTPGAAIGGNSISQTGGGISGTGGNIAGTPPTTVGGETNYLGGVQGGLTSGLGLLGILQSIQSGNPGPGLQGGVTTLRGISELLNSSPELAQSLGISPDVVSGLKTFFGPGGSLSGGVANIGAGIGLLGGLTGEQTLSDIGSAIGGIPTAALIASAIPALSSGLTTALSANPYTAAVAAAINQIMQLYSDLQQDRSAPNVILNGLAAPIPVVGSLLTKQINKIWDPSEAWMTFPSRVMQTVGGEATDLSALNQGLSRVQSQQELQSLLDTFKASVRTSGVGDYGQGSGAFDIPTLPEVGPTTHGYATTPSNLAPLVAESQQVINMLRSVLPETGRTYDPVADFYQFMPRRDIAPVEYMTNDPNADIGLLNSQMPYTRRLYSYTGTPYAPGTAPSETTLMYGDPGYNYALAGYPDPGQFVGGDVSPYWATLGLPNFNPRYRGPQIAAPMPTPELGPTGWVLNSPVDGPIAGYTYVTPQAAPVFGSPEWFAAFGPGGAGISTA